MKVAIKFYKKSKIKNVTKLNRILQEIQILRNCSHQNIIQLYEIFENSEYLFIVLEYA